MASTTMVFSSEAPRPRPMARSCSTSAMKPKVRAGAISARKLAGSTASSSRWRPMAGASKMISTDSSKRGAARARRACRVRPPRSAPGSRYSGGARPGGAAGGVDRGGEIGGRAVEDRRFGAVELNTGVVDPEAGEGGHQMLDGRDGGSGVVADDGGQAGVADPVGEGCDGLPVAGDSVRTKTTPVSAGAGGWRG